MKGHEQARQQRWAAPLRTLAFAASAGILVAASSSTAQAQATSASIFGWGPAGKTVLAKSTSGMRRHATINDSGRYSIRALPLGTYSVSLEQGDKLVDTRPNIKLTIGRNAEVDFACPNDKCAKPDS